MNRFFRNVRLYRIFSQWPSSEEALSEVLENAAFKPCGAYTERSGGFEPPFARTQLFPSALHCCVRTSGGLGPPMV